MANITLLPSAKVPLVYPEQSTMTTEWYRFFWNIYGFTATGTIPVDKGGTGLNTIGNHQIIIGNADNVFEPASFSSASIAITYPAGYVNLELGTSGVTPGTYGSASQVGIFTVNQYGVLTAASNTFIGIDASQIISGTIASARISGAYVGITGVGILATGTWNATTIGTLYGGTGLTSFTSGGALYATSTSALTTGTLPVASGGTGQSSFTNGQLLIGNTTGNTLTKTTLTAGTGVSITNGAGSITISATGTGGTVTSVAALTLGTTGTDLSSTVANGTTTPVITLNVPTASATNRGALSSTDWSTFNGKQAALVSGTNIKTVGGVSLLGSGDVGTIGATYGGTGQSSYAVGDILYASTTTALSKLADVATGNALISGGVGVAPSYGKIGLTTHVSGTLAVGNGGTGITTLTAGYIPYGNGTGALSSSANLTFDGTNLSVTGNINVTGSGNIGYGTGSGGTVTQLVSKSAGVTLNKRTGRITMNNAALAAGASVSFYLTNSTITNEDVVVVNIWANGNYRAVVETSYATIALITVTNLSIVSLSDAVGINFAVIKCATS